MIGGPIVHQINHQARILQDLLRIWRTTAHSSTTARAGITAHAERAPTGRARVRKPAVGILTGTLGLATAPCPANAVLVIRTPPESGHTIYDTFDDEKRVI